MKNPALEGLKIHNSEYSFPRFLILPPRRSSTAYFAAEAIIDFAMAAAMAPGSEITFKNGACLREYDHVSPDVVRSFPAFANISNPPPRLPRPTGAVGCCSQG